jgi:DegV family protein with EDD domain
LKNFVISVDSSASFTEEELEKYGILMVRLSYTLDGQEHTDRFEDSAQMQALYDKLALGYPAQSSKANPQSFADTWRAALEAGHDILHLSLSNQVSGSYESACMAAEELGREYGRRVLVVDTLTGSFAVTALALDLLRLRGAATVEEARDFALAGLNEYNLIFTIGDIRHLHRGGRISHVKALIGGLLHLKPILFINEQGGINFLMNARGTRQALSLMAQKLMRSMTACTDCAYIAHGGDESLAEKLKEKITELIPRINVRIDYLTPALGIHGGPGALVLSFKGAQRGQVAQDGPVREKLSAAMADV